MRYLSNFIARGVVAVAVVTILAAPIAEARTRDDDSWFLSRTRIVKFLKKLGLITTGDDLSVPKP
ncbi:MAG TPA: hypothetical protein VMU84_12195 [Thermoanaerobaculia bacterium]|nr:hypothetical protein [Thermoanaerobaculia bacterium]